MTFPERLPNEGPSWTELKTEIEQQVSLRQTELEIAGQKQTWYCVANPDDLLDRAIALEGKVSHEESNPFWAANWRSALALDRFLGGLPIRGEPILELGCGTGQAGAAAAMRGAIVTATDSVELALAVTRLNTWTLGRRLKTAKLIWGDEAAADQRFPIIIGSDVTYDSQHFARLECTARQYLSSGGMLYLSEPGRHSGDHFVRLLRRQQWIVDETRLDLDDGRSPIRILSCQRRSHA